VTNLTNEQCLERLEALDNAIILHESSEESGHPARFHVHTQQDSGQCRTERLNASPDRTPRENLLFIPS